MLNDVHTEIYYKIYNMECIRRERLYYVMKQKKYLAIWLFISAFSSIEITHILRNTEIKENMDFLSAGILILILFQDAVSST